MDVFTDAARQHQIHDVNPENGGTPGNASGLFWTIRIPGEAVEVNSPTNALLSVADLDLRDNFQLFHATSSLARLSVAAEWEGNLGAVHLSETSEGSRFMFDGVKTRIELRWQIETQISASDPRPFEFHSVGNPTALNYVVLGIERNGIYA